MASVSQWWSSVKRSLNLQNIAESAIATVVGAVILAYIAAQRRGGS